LIEKLIISLSIMLEFVKKLCISNFQNKKALQCNAFLYFGLLELQRT